MAGNGHALGAHRVIIVTTWYHSRRALACFEHYAPDITFYSRPSYFGYPAQTKPETLKEDHATPQPEATSSGQGHLLPSAEKGISPAEAERVRAARKYEWKTVRGYANSEYLKLAGYWVCYGVCPF